MAARASSRSAHIQRYGASQAVLDPRRNADGTFYVYTCDWAVFSPGPFNEAEQTALGYIVIAKNRYRLPGGTPACKLPS